jgi:hypothetical protein
VSAVQLLTYAVPAGFVLLLLAAAIADIAGGEFPTGRCSA